MALLSISINNYDITVVTRKFNSTVYSIKYSSKERSLFSTSTGVLKKGVNICCWLQCVLATKTYLLCNNNATIWMRKLTLIHYSHLTSNSIKMLLTVPKMPFSKWMQPRILSGFTELTFLIMSPLIWNSSIFLGLITFTPWSITGQACCRVFLSLGSPDVSSWLDSA